LENSLFKNITSKPLYFGITFVKMTQDIMTNDELISIISMGGARGMPLYSLAYPRFGRKY